MSNDVARIIWEMAKADKSLDGLALKDMYHRKLEMDGDELRTKLKNLGKHWLLFYGNPFF